jgi:hypothetical protein
MSCCSNPAKTLFLRLSCCSLQNAKCVYRWLNTWLDLNYWLTGWFREYVSSFDVCVLAIIKDLRQHRYRAFDHK